MADNVTVNTISGSPVVATDDDGTAQHQYVKLEWGANNTFTKVDDVDGARVPIKPHMAGTATRTAVADSAVSGTILAANSARKRAIITNDSSAILYVAYGAGPATSTDYTVTVQPSGDTHVVEVYTGIITGIWATDPNDGGARVTELT